MKIEKMIGKAVIIVLILITSTSGQLNRTKITFSATITIPNINENSKGVTQLFNFSAPTSLLTGDPIMYYAKVTPSDGNFQFTSTDGVLSTIANANFNYERQKQYQIVVTATDGVETGSVTVTLDIDDVNEAPKLLNVPATMLYHENFPLDAPPKPWRVLYYVKGEDPDTAAVIASWKTLTYHMGTVFPKSRSPPYSDAFELDQTSGELRAKISLNHEVYDQYLFRIWTQDGAGLKSTDHILNLDIANVNEAPWFNVSSPPYYAMYHGAETYSCEIYEESPIGMQLPIPAITAYDEDVNDTLIYQLEGRDHVYFEIKSINGSASIYVKKRIDFEQMEPEQRAPYLYKNQDRFFQTSSFTITLYVSAYDKELLRTLDTDLPKTAGHNSETVGKASWFIVKVQVYDINDHLPECNPTFYTATIRENTPVDTSILTISCTDEDYDKKIAYTVNGSALASNYFWVETQSPEGVLKTKGPADIETTTSVQFYVYAYQGLYPNRTSANVTVLIHIIPENDHIPVFKKPFYNLEIRYDAPIGTAVGRVSATDKDTGTTALLSYHWVSTNTLFKLTAHAGIISTLKTLENAKTYVYHAHAKDNDVPPKFSEHISVRIDTFNPEPYLVDFEVAQPLSYFTEAIVEEFEAAISSACPPCVGRVSSMKSTPNSPDSTTLTVYALKDATTESYANVDQPKYFVSLAEMLEIFSSNSEGQPSTAVALTTFHKFPVVSVKAHETTIYLTASEWLLTTPGGKFIIALLSMLAIALFLTGLVYLLKWLIPLLKKLECANCAKCDIPKIDCDCFNKKEPPPPSPAKKIEHPDGEVRVMDFRYKDAPLVPPTILKPTTA
ncbi:cadherin EGF LAG seven-pass G-type receptor 2-like [Tubulanus polymorphus]|uniref:cadherin EGF LAG seven-pass G-type receptor 2-like n=1 Tax=Tubulanus polymorphus TaxID=672921 RepID=UPI003DA34405